MDPKGGRLGTAGRITTSTKMGNVNLPEGLDATAGLLVDRPVTQQGIGGIKTATKGPQRQFYDRTYYLNKLKTKNKELANEIARFKTDVSKINKDFDLYQKLEQKYEDLNKEVRELEGTLADYNLAVDKERTGTKPQEISDIIIHLKNQTSRYRAQLDEIFIERKDQESQIKQIDLELRQLAEMAIIKMNELDENQRKEYLRLKDINRQTEEELTRSRRELEELNFKSSQIDNKLRMDHTRLKVIHLKKQIHELEEKKEDLEEQCKEATMPIPELRERLLQRMKEDRAKIQETETRTRELKRGLDQMKRKYREMEDELSGNAQISEENKQKYEAIYKKEQDIEQFMKNFQSLREKELEDISKKQQMILQYMENISHSLNLMKRAPNTKEFEQMKNNLATQNRQTNDAESTLKLVKSQLNNRMSNLEKLKDIESTLPAKLEKLVQNKDHMKKELQKFMNTDKIVEEMTLRRQKLSKRSQEMNRMGDKLKQDLESVTNEFKQKKKALQSHKAYSDFSNLESQIGQNEQLINNVKNFVSSKKQEMNITPQIEKCNIIATQINEYLIRG